MGAVVTKFAGTQSLTMAAFNPSPTYTSLDSSQKLGLAARFQDRPMISWLNSTGRITSMSRSYGVFTTVT